MNGTNDMMTPTLSRINETTSWILQKIKSQHNLTPPRVALVLGSGLSPIADELLLQPESCVLKFSEIPHFSSTTVHGHLGQMVIGNFKGVPTLIMQGRFHYYEGHGIEQVIFPIQVFKQLGIKTVIVTNASGGVNTRYAPGDVMIIEDHINLTGTNPLIGKNIPELGPRFPDMSDTYTKALRLSLLTLAQNLNIPLKSGIYAGVSGPCYETPAEIRMLRTLGADAVGMSTVPEVIAASHAGLQVLGLSCITNLGAGMSNGKLTHEEVIHNSQLSVEAVRTLLLHALPLWFQENIL
jgi:purine-nucleoside phosphorylase